MNEKAMIREQLERARANVSVIYGTVNAGDDKKIEIRRGQAEVARLERLLNADAALDAARGQWKAASAAQVQAAKVAEAARDELTRLDTLLAEEEGKTKAAQDAQRAAILAKLGISATPGAPGSPGVSALESALIGAAANVDALRTARPVLEARVSQADAAVAACDRATREAEQAILDAKHSLAERVHEVALAAYRDAWLQFHGAGLAATGRHMPPLMNITAGLTDADYVSVAQGLKAQAEQGE